MTANPTQDRRLSEPEPTIEFWFEFASNYSYLSVMRIEALAQDHGFQIAWKPFLLGPIFSALGWNNSPFVLQKEKGAYVWRDMARQCQKYGLPWTQPTVFPRGSVLALRVAILATDEPWLAGFCQRIMLRNFAEDKEIQSADDVAAVLAQMGLPAAELIASAQSDENKQRLRIQTDEARSRGVFGAPMFFVGDEMFWGNDRLDEAVAIATHPRDTGTSGAP